MFSLQYLKVRSHRCVFLKHYWNVHFVQFITRVRSMCCVACSRVYLVWSQPWIYPKSYQTRAQGTRRATRIRGQFKTHRQLQPFCQQHYIFIIPCMYVNMQIRPKKCIYKARTYTHKIYVPTDTKMYYVRVLPAWRLTLYSDESR